MPACLCGDGVLANHERHPNRNDAGRAVIHVPNAVRCQPLAETNGQARIELVLAVGALDDDAAHFGRDATKIRIVG
jgi:hypothetical protein